MNVLAFKDRNSNQKAEVLQMSDFLQCPFITIVCDLGNFNGTPIAHAFANDKDFIAPVKPKTIAKCIAIDNPPMALTPSKSPTRPMDISPPLAIPKS